MTKHVILLTEPHEAPAYELIEALQTGGVKTLVQVLDDMEGDAKPTTTEPDHSVIGPWDLQPLAIVYEVIPTADIVDLQTALNRAQKRWQGIPMVACRRGGDVYQRPASGMLDGLTLKRLGFRAIADKVAQLPAILREIEGHGATGELKLPDIVQKPGEPTSLSLPAGLKAPVLRAAFDLVSSLHFIGDQIGAANTVIEGLNPLVSADQWTIYLVDDAPGAGVHTLKAIATKKTR